jgi:nucleotide-binding universal stress UspA family protein
MRTFRPRHILCPVDFSSHSELALRLAGGIAAAFGADVIVLHAQRFEPPLYFTEAQTASLKAQLRRSLRAARSFLEDFAQKQLPNGLPRSVEVVEADPVPAILEFCKKSPADLIVMGTHGRTGLTKIRLGSITESVLQQITIPIITVGPQVTPFPAGGRIRRILSPVDYSDLARAAFEHAVVLSQKLKAELVVTHVVEAGGTLDEARQALCDWVPAGVREQCSFKEVVRQGEPAEQILQELKKSRADLLVIGAAPRNVLGAMLFGSTTEKLIRSAPCPVFSVIGRQRSGSVGVQVSKVGQSATPSVVRTTE